MSIRSAIRAALASIAKLVLVPVEIVVGGVRTVISVLMPARNTSALDAAEEIVAEDTAAESLEALAAAREARRAAAMVRKSEPERVRQVARDLRTGRDVSRVLFDPSVREEKEVADWLRTLDHLHLGHLANATDAEIEGHLAGEKRLPLPLLPADEKRAEEERESRRMPTELEWVQILITRRVENGDEPDGDTMDDLLRQARQLAESRARVGDHLPRRINADSRCGEDA